VYLANCLGTPKIIQFLNESDKEVYVKYFKQIMFHIVIFHELLGHGCGKLL